MPGWKQILMNKRILMFGLTFILIWVIIQINHLIFKKLKAHNSRLQLLFFERLISVIIVIGGTIMAFSMLGGFETVWKTMLGGTAILSAILIFAAQDIAKDILGGLMITLYKPFEIGNRVELEDGTTGIVKDITMRHVVLQALDTQVVIVPNSKLNVMRIRNYSYHMNIRSNQFEFQVSYDTDVEKAISVIRQAVIDSPLTIPGKQMESGMEYANVYFLGYKESSLRLATTVYFEPTSPSEAVISDINLRVGKALKENGIEIPYPYVNVIADAKEEEAAAEPGKEESPDSSAQKEQEEELAGQVQK